MLAKVIIENGQKKIQALTADTGTGAPVGSYLYLEKKSNPQGYLYCDGSTFDETAYPALYQYLGTNVLPDWRELGAKGAEKNTTLIFDSTETDPSTGQAGTQNHDVFTQGEFKDDQLQEHKHSLKLFTAEAGSNANLPDYATDPDDTSTGSRYTLNVANARVGTVTRGKSRAVFIYIKATSGLTENQQENVLNTINENNSYSTEEHPTGKKWIDGKKIYRKAFYSTTNWGGVSSTVGTIPANSNIVSIRSICTDSSNNVTENYFYTTGSSDLNLNQAYYSPNGDIKSLREGIFATQKPSTIIVEYTKTTDN